MDLLTCRVCGHGEAKSLGQIPDGGEFAGQHISPPIKGGELWICNECGSMFRHPTLSASKYISLYEKAPGTVWVGDETERNDFGAIYAYLKRHPGGSILDVGCYTGNFLAGLPGKFEKYGIEPSMGAWEMAVSKHINMLGKTLDDLEPGKVFDVVVLIDVVEHVIDVESLMGQALRHVKENGLLMISTGNPGCFFWRKVFKSKFWYCFFPEHVTFPSYKYFVEFSERSKLRTPEQFCFRYKKMGVLTRLVRLLLYITSESLPDFYRALRNLRNVVTGRGAGATVQPGSLMGVFSDHHLVVIKKEGRQSC